LKKKSVFSSLRTKLSVLTIIIVSLCAFLYSAIGVHTLARESKKDASEIMNITCLNSATGLNSQFSQIEYCLDAMAEYCKRYAPEEWEVVHNDQIFYSHNDSVKAYFRSLISIIPNVQSYYYRYMPDAYSEYGFWYISDNLDGSFHEETPTDITQYEEGDIEHAAWFWIPKETGEPLWIEPYWNANDEVYTLSYVVPLKRSDGTVFGVVGIDLDFDTIIDEVNAISTYETGRASLVNEDGTIAAHKSLETGTDIRDLSDDLAKLADHLHEESSGSEIYEYELDGEERELAFCSLRNGMRLVLSVPLSKINEPLMKTIQQYLAILLASIIIFALLVHFVMRKTTEPLVQLTGVAKELESGNMDVAFPEVTDDEIGVLNETMQSMARNLGHLLQSLSRQAYVDALTGVRNKGAFEEASLKLNRGEEKFAYVMFDVNYLKKINDTYGHEKGDVYLKTACHLICKAFAHCPVYRLGGDEFAAILTGDNYDQAYDLMAGMDKMVEEANAKTDNPWEKVDCAKGIAFFDPEKDTYRDNLSEEILKEADSRMYENKREKRRI